MTERKPGVHGLDAYREIRCKTEVSSTKQWTNDESLVTCKDCLARPAPKPKESPTQQPQGG